MSNTIGEAFKALSEDVLSGLRRVGVRELSTPLVKISVSAERVMLLYGSVQEDAASSTGWVKPCMRPTRLLTLWRELEAVLHVAKLLDAVLEKLEQYPGAAHQEQKLGPFVVTGKCAHRAQRSASDVTMRRPLVETLGEVTAAIERDAQAIEEELRSSSGEQRALEELQTAAAAYLFGRVDR